METTLIEVTQVTVASGIALSPRKRLIGAAYIALIDGGGLDGTSIITLSTGEKFNVTESYDELKTLLGVGAQTESKAPERRPEYGYAV